MKDKIKENQMKKCELSQKINSISNRKAKARVELKETVLRSSKLEKETVDKEKLIEVLV